MSIRISEVIKAPAGVQLNRLAFSIYCIFFGWPLPEYRQGDSWLGLLIWGAFVGCSVLGFGYTFVRAPRARWIVATLGLAIPSAFWTMMIIFIFSRPAWWEWPLAVGMLLSIPIALVLILFRDKKTAEYFIK
jgi:hypothetical protein